MTRVRLSLVALAALAACGGGTGPVSPPPPPPPPPPPAPVATVVVAPGAASMVPLETVQLTATPRDAAGTALTGRSIAWASNASGVATVSASGLVSAVAAGSATISATSEGQTGSAAVTVGEGGFVTGAGGSVSAFGGDLVLVVPTGGVSAGVALQVARDTAPPANAALVAGTGFAVSPAATAFAPVATLRIRYPASAASGPAPAAGNPANFAVHRWSGTEWLPLGDGQVDVEPRVVSGTTAVAGTFAILEVIPNPAPTVSGVVPLSIVAGGPARQLAVTGTGFVPGSVARWNGQDRATTFQSATALTVTIPAEDLVDPGSAQLTVFNPAPGGGTSSPVVITIAASQPTGVEAVVGSFHLCASRDDGQAVCWGNNGNRELGRPGSSSRVPVAVSGGHHLTHLTAGASHTCALDPTGAAWCWGLNLNGQIGDGSTTNRDTPTAVVGHHVFVGLVAGPSHTCGLTDGGAAWCWGRNFRGQLGNGGTTDSPVPVAVGGGLMFTRLAAGFDATCGLKSDGTAWCWGLASRLGIGQTGGGSLELAPVAVNGGLHFSEIRGGRDSFCGRTEAGTVYCWGSNANGELGIGTFATAAGEPTAVAGGLSFATLASGLLFYCGTSAPGDLYCWGANSGGQLGDGSIATRREPTRALTSLRFARLSLGERTACGITAQNELYCWGFRDFFALLTDEIDVTQREPALVAGGHTFARIAAGDQETCGITTGGTTYCWGRTYAAGDPVDRPTPVALGGQALESVAAGADAGCGLSAAGAGFCFGANVNAILGTGNLGGGSPVPVPVAGGLTLSAVSVGGIACGLTMPGTLYCWGNLSTAPGASTQPRAVPGGGAFASVVTGTAHACMLTAGGAAFCRGSHGFGQLGHGVAPCNSTTCAANSDAPVAVAGGHLFSTLAAGGVRSCGVATDGTGYCWGSMPLATEAAGAPVAVPGTVKFARLAVGASATCGIGRDDGITYCWGFGGLLGIGDNVTRPEPAPIQGPLLVQISAGRDHTCGITAAGAAWCWGRRTGGQIGDGRLEYSAMPVRVTW
ncbi:MAG: Ig-like domain-containing protein [Gemmatimonadales bacterium]